MPARREGAGGGAQFFERAVVAEEPGCRRLLPGKRQLGGEPILDLAIGESVARSEAGPLGLR